MSTGSPSSHHHHHHHLHHHSFNHSSSLHSPSSSSSVTGPSAAQNQFTPSSSSSTSGSNSSDLHETMRWPYEEDELLNCIDNEELPLMFVDLFEKRCPQLFYSGCVIVEVRDYRQSFPISTACDKFHVLLRPTNQTLLADVQALTSEGEWSHEDKMTLESQLILATAEPLCLDPDPQVGINSINGQHERRMFNSMPIRRHAKKFSQVAINRKRKTDQFTHHFGLELFDFMARHRQRPRLSLGSCGTPSSSSGGAAGPTTPTTSLNSFAAAAAARLKRTEVQPVRAPSLNLPETLQVPTGEVNVERFARAFDRPRETKDCMPQLVEEYVLETDRGNGRVNFIRLSILQRPSNSEFLGMLYLDRDYKEDEKNGEACQFSLGTRAHANRYIQQFTEIFTEEGRKKVKITHVVPGQQPRVTCTTGLWEQHQQQQQQQPSQQDPQQQQPQLQAPLSHPQVVQQQTVMDQNGAVMQNAVAATFGGAGGGASQGQHQQVLLGKVPQFSFQMQQQPSQQQVMGGNLGINKLQGQLQQQQQPPQQTVQQVIPGGGAATVTLTSPVMQQQQPQPQPQQPPQLANSQQIKLLSTTNLGPNQFIQFATVPQQSQQSMDGGQTTTVGGVAGGHQHPIQYAAIMNCDNNLLKNAISSGSQLGIRNGSLVLLQQNQTTGKTSAVSLVQTASGQLTTAGSSSSGSGGANTQATTTQMHVTTLPQGLNQGAGGSVAAGSRQIVGSSGGVLVSKS